VNDGKGQFTGTTQLQDVFTTGACVSVSDFDKDGDLDLFIGSRTTPWKYGMKPDSYLIENDGKGNFKNVTSSKAPDLQKFGFVKKASWADIDNDKDDDLIIAAEWSPITIFLNDKGKFSRLENETSGLSKTNGWWNVIEPVDIDNDGDLDLIAGNLGLNSKLKASVEQPVKMFVSDFDKNDSTDQVLTHYMRGKEYPFHTRDEMTKQMPFLKKRYLSYHKFSEATAEDMFGDALESALKYEVYTFRSCVFENLGNNKFKVRSLPSGAQMSMISSVIAEDFNGDGFKDLILGGNFHPVNIQRGRYDASYGLLLEGDGKGNFKVVPSVRSGISISGEIRSIKKIKVGEKYHYLAVRNNEPVESFVKK
jgi:hypothetical protein